MYFPTCEQSGGMDGEQKFCKTIHKRCMETDNLPCFLSKPIAWSTKKYKLYAYIVLYLAWFSISGKQELYIFQQTFH